MHQTRRALGSDRPFSSSVREALYAPRPTLPKTAGFDAKPTPLLKLLCALRGLTSYVWGDPHGWRENARAATLGWSRLCLEHVGEPERAAQARITTLYGVALNEEWFARRDDDG